MFSEYIAPREKNMMEFVHNLIRKRVCIGNFNKNRENPDDFEKVTKYRIISYI